MHFNHLGLPVRDERRSQQFYAAYFGFDPATAQEYADGTVIIRNADGFDLALHPVTHVEPSPPFLHADFKAAGPADVRALMERMEADGITIAKRDDEAASLQLEHGMLGYYGFLHLAAASALRWWTGQFP
jgi:catechol 2,3-dioxygenase-like lactoylglutathione lyase family enzyme